MRILPDGTKIVWEPLKGSQTLSLTCPADIVVFHGTRGPGKGLPLNEPVYTERGPRPIGDLKVGDSVCCPDGTSAKVIEVFPQGKRPTYEIEFSDGAISRCDDVHIWPIHIQDGNRPGSVREYGYQLMTMTEVLNKFETGTSALHVPTLSSLKMRYTQHPYNNRLKVDPYLLGLILGDGSLTQQGSYCTVDNELAEYVVKAGFKEWSPDKRAVNHKIRNFGIDLQCRDNIKSYGLWGKLSDGKFIPEVYLHHSDESRLAVLQGLMDTDGYIDTSGYIVFSSSSIQLSKDVQYLVRSLGGNATLRTVPSYCNGVRHKDTHTVYIQPGNKFIPFRLERKVCRIKKFMHEKLWKRIVAIRELGEQETVCIKISHPLGLFITRDFVVTHNTDAQLMRFRARVGQGYGRYWRGIIFDREYKNLDDLVSKSMRWFPEFKDGARFLSSKSDYRWVWPTGEELLFRAIKKDTDYWGYHGQEFPFIGWNELTKYPNDALFEMLMSCNRSSFLKEEHPYFIGNSPVPHYLPEIPLEVFATTNPHGVGHNWVKKRFINPGKPGQIVKKVINVFNPRTQQREDVTKTQTHIFGSYRENKYLSPQYVAELESITDPNKRRAWLYGDWDIIAGGMFDDVWDKDIHIIAPFDIPSNWRIDRSFDWGESRPFSVGWWAEADGSDVKLSDGRWISTVKGDLFRIAEWYGWTGKANQGLRLLASEVAEGIVEREIELGIYNKVVAGPADNSIWDVDNGKSIAADMAKPVKLDRKRYRGVRWLRSDKSKGSRKAGWKQIRQALKDALPQVMTDSHGNVVTVPRENPGLFIFNSCTMFVELFPIAPRDEVDPDDIDTNSEDHIADEVRYKILSTNIGARGGKTLGF